MSSADSYLKLLEYVTNENSINIPEHWVQPVLECIECITAISTFVEILSVEKMGEDLFITYDLNGYEMLRAYIEEEIYFANMELKKLERGESDMLYGADDNRCKKCQIITSKAIGVEIDGNLYCRQCALEIKPPTLVIHKRADKVYVIGEKVTTKPVNITMLLDRCDWFLRHERVWNDGSARYELEFRGNKICRAFEENDKYKNLLPRSWYSCRWYGSCPFS